MNFDKVILYFSDVFREETMRHDLNSLLRHLLVCFSQTGNYLYFADVIMMNSRGISFITLCYRKALISTDVLVKFVQTAIDSCCVIQNKLNGETKPGCAQDLISAMAQTIIIVRAVILVIMKRSDKNVGKEDDIENSRVSISGSNYRISQILLEELLNRCPAVSAPFHGFEYPVANVLFNVHYKPYFYATLTKYCTMYYLSFMKMLVQSQCDISATDSQGNTILHNVVYDMLQEIDFFNEITRYHNTIVMDAAVEVVEIFLENGSYPHAKNKKGKHLLDGFIDYKPKSSLNAKTILVRCKDLMTKYDCTLTLKYMAAKTIVHSKIPYRNLLPQALVKFVDLH